MVLWRICPVRWHCSNLKRWCWLKSMTHPAIKWLKNLGLKPNFKRGNLWNWKMNKTLKTNTPKHRRTHNRRTQTYQYPDSLGQTSQLDVPSSAVFSTSQSCSWQGLWAIWHRESYFKAQYRSQFIDYGETNWRSGKSLRQFGIPMINMKTKNLFKEGNWVWI